VARGIRKVAEALPAGLSSTTPAIGPSVIPAIGRLS
jgi:hypothetical protein